MNDADALQFARKHVDTWNSHDLEAIMALYSESAELVSPLAASLVGESTLRGREALRDYFARGLQKYPALRFALINTFRCQSSVTLLFRGAGERLVAEVLFLGADRKIERVYAHYACLAPEEE